MVYRSYAHCDVSSYPTALPFLVQHALCIALKPLVHFPLTRSKQVAEALATSEALEATHTGPCDRVGEVGRMLRRFHKQANPTAFNLNHSINGVDQVGAADGPRGSQGRTRMPGPLMS